MVYGVKASRRSDDEHAVSDAGFSDPQEETRLYENQAGGRRNARQGGDQRLRAGGISRRHPKQASDLQRETERSGCGATGSRDGPQNVLGEGRGDLPESHYASSTRLTHT